MGNRIGPCANRHRATGTFKGKYCNGTWDTVLCWPATSANTTIKQHCPPRYGLDPTKYVYKQCGPTGQWEGRVPGDYSKPQGWTNYSNCYTPEAWRMYKKFYGDKSPAQKQMLRDIAYGARVMEIAGLCLSLLAIAISLFIFFYFRSLKNARTRIHRNLFLAILIHIIISLFEALDWFISTTSHPRSYLIGQGGEIFQTAILCEILVSIKEYTKTVMFMWMLIEGIQLHNMIAISVFSNKPNYKLFYALGWLFPALPTLVWSILNACTYARKCWSLYHFIKSYWIIEAPRAIVISLNLIFLLNIIRVLVTKMRDSNSSEALQARKAVKAAIVLLPLLGITNFVVMIEIQHTDLVNFAIWVTISHFLTSFQGFFISLLYCFLNGEVKMVIKRHWRNYLNHRHHLDSRKSSKTYSAGFTSVTEVVPAETKNAKKKRRFRRKKKRKEPKEILDKVQLTSKSVRMTQCKTPKSQPDESTFGNPMEYITNGVTPVSHHVNN
ncbi:unnamed protein product, partial [Owenia fusiformis]